MATTTHKEPAMIPNYIIHSLEFNKLMLNRILSSTDDRYMPGDRAKFIAEYEDKIAFCEKEIERLQNIYA